MRSDPSGQVQEVRDADDAELTQHIPDPRTHLVRYFGWYSSELELGPRPSDVSATSRRDAGG